MTIKMIEFGVARKYHKNLIPFLKELKANNIHLYEMGFAYSIPEEIPGEVIEFAKNEDITLSCHLPFYINLGNKKLQFFSVPYWHWPDTMFSYLVEDKILFHEAVTGKYNRY